MSAAPRAPHAFRLVVPSDGPRFLGLPLAERNRRVARRGGADDSADATLIVPDGAAITPALLPALPSAGSASVMWGDQRPPLQWSSGRPGPAIAMHADGVMVLDASTPRARYASSWRLLRASGKPGDGWLSRHIHRKVSRIFSYLFLQLGLTANIATFLTFCVGAAGAWLMAQTTHETMIAGALLYWGSSIADGIDGEMARLTLSESAFGEQLDTGVDQATHLLALTGAGIGWWRQGLGSAGLALAVVVALGVPIVLLWAMALVRRARGSRAFFVVTKPIELAVVRAAADTGSIVLRAASAVFVLFRREAMAFTCFVVSLFTGLRVVYPALVAGGLAIVMATFLIYRSALVRALQHVSR